MQAIERRRRKALIFIVFLLFMLFGISAAHRRDCSGAETALRKTPWTAKWFPFTCDPTVNTGHPVSTLMQDAKAAFIKRLAKQSKTLSEAVAEYKRRYGRDPPRGFDDWWEFAQENDFKLVDEFDAIVEDLAPFWELSGEELRHRTYQVGHLPSIDLMRIEDGKVSRVLIEKDYVDQEGGNRFLGFLSLIERFQHELPNMDIAINTRAEGRVLVPWEHMRYPHLTKQDLPKDVTRALANLTADWQGDGSVWEEYRRTCSPDATARHLYSSYRDPNIPSINVVSGRSNDPFVFATTVDNNFDFCRNPWARYTQGHFFSDWRTFPVLYPVFSPSKAKGFADIRIPGHYYHEGSIAYTYAWDPVSEEVKKVDDMEVPWDEKSEKIFWRGSTTGGGSTPQGFTPNYQRHRFLRMTHESAPQNVTIAHASPRRSNTFTTTTVPAKDLNDDIMDVAFVAAVGSYPGGESELRKRHRFAESVPLGKHWSYKYLVDLDGMSYSGRFIGFMASDSVVLKSTIYKEYFSDWIQPWLHYIPLSSSYSEIYNIHSYFSGPSASTMDIVNKTVRHKAEWEAVKKTRDMELRQIARAGKQWKHTLGRKNDMEVYVYRLCLEYARLWADDRDAMSFIL